MIRELRRLFGFSGAEHQSLAPASAPVPSVSAPAVSTQEPETERTNLPEASPTASPPRGLKPARLKPKHDVFISYCHSDWEQAKLLERDLEAYGLNVWRDDRMHIAPDKNAIDSVNDAFLHSARVLVLWSADSVHSQWVKDEASAARNAHKIICLALPPIGPQQIPAEFHSLPVVALSEIRSDPKLLLRHLGAEENPRQPGCFTLVHPAVNVEHLPPTFATTLFGRDKELDFLAKSWDKGAKNLVAFEAMGGAGKTAILVHFVQALEATGWRGARAVFAWSFPSQGSSEERQGDSSKFFETAFAFLANGPSPEWAKVQAEAVSQGFEELAWPPQDEREKGAELARHVQARRTLLLLDGLEPLQYAASPKGKGNAHLAGGIKDPAVKALLEALVDQNPGLCVVTTQIELPELRDREGFEAIALASLDSVSSIRLLRSLGVESDFPSSDFHAWREVRAGETPITSGHGFKTVPEGHWYLPIYAELTGQLALEIQSCRVPRDFVLPDDLLAGLEKIDRPFSSQAFPVELTFRLLLTTMTFEGHALSLTLLANSLRTFHQGSIDSVRDVPLLEIYAGKEKLPFSVLRATEIGLVRQILDPSHDRRQHPGETDAGRQLAVLLFLAFFDRPVSTSLLNVVFPSEPPALDPEQDPPIEISGLEPIYRKHDEPDDVWCALALRVETERRALFRALFIWTQGYSGQLLEGALDHLAAQGLVQKVDKRKSWDRTEIDCHPLVRSYFERRLRELDPSTFEAAHDRLYEHCRSAAEQLPETAAGMEPLFAAIRHGCLARRQTDCFGDVYWPRIARGNECFASRRLGLAGEDLAALSGFFEEPFRRPCPLLSPEVQAFILGVAAYALRTLGRRCDAVAPMRAAADLAAELADHENAAAGYGALGELLLTLGRLEDKTGEEGAIATSTRAVAFADQAGDPTSRIQTRATEAAALFARGRLRQAEDRFREAERLTKENPSPLPWLDSVSGFLYGELLLARRRFQELEERATRSLGSAEVLLDMALAQLNQARAQELQRPLETGNLKPAFLSALQRTNEEELLARAYLAIAESGLGSAESNRNGIIHALTEVEVIAKRGPMPLLLADANLIAARAAWKLGGSELAWKHRNEAAALIEGHQYGRRAPDLAVLDAEMSPSPDTFQAACDKVGDEGWWHLLSRLETLAAKIPSAEARLVPLREAEKAYHAERDADLAGQAS